MAQDRDSRFWLKREFQKRVQKDASMGGGARETKCKRQGPALEVQDEEGMTSWRTSVSWCLRRVHGPV